MTTGSNEDRESAPLRLDWVSPLPPVRSGIADYSVDLAPALEPLCDLRLVRLPGQEVAAAVVERWSPAPVESLGEGGRLPWYQMGNNVHHEAVRRLALERPAFLTLHDVWLHHLLMECTLAHGDLVGYVEALTADHGWVGGAVALPPRWSGYGQAGLFALPAHRSLLAAQRGVLVHSEWARSLLEEEIPGLPVRTVPMPMPVACPDGEGRWRIEGAELRRELGIPLSAPLLGSFGFQTPIKRTEVVVRALARPGLERAWLLIGGQVAPEVDLDAVARGAGVRDRVRVTGYLSEERFARAIAACDLCVNLRYPTAGETSASLLRILAAGKPALVSDYAQFVDLPAEVVRRVPLEHVLDDGDEAAAVALAAADLMGDRRRLEAMGRQAREWVRVEHAPARAARAMIEALREMAARPAAGPLGAVPRRPTTLTWGWLPSRLQVAGAETPWPAGTRRRLEVCLTNTGFATWLPGGEPEGGVALETRLWDRRGEELAGERWRPLPRRLEPGESYRWQLSIRRPPGPARLRFEPQVIGGGGFPALRGAAWERVLP